MSLSLVYEATAVHEYPPPAFLRGGIPPLWECCVLPSQFIWGEGGGHKLSGSRKNNWDDCLPHQLCSTHPSCMTGHIGPPQVTAASSQCLSDNTSVISISWSPAEDYFEPHPNMTFLLTLNTSGAKQSVVVVGKVRELLISSFGQWCSQGLWALWGTVRCGAVYTE